MPLTVWPLLLDQKGIQDYLVEVGGRGGRLWEKTASRECPGIRRDRGSSEVPHEGRHLKNGHPANTIEGPRT